MAHGFGRAQATRPISPGYCEYSTSIFDLVSAYGAPPGKCAGRFPRATAARGAPGYGRRLDGSGDEFADVDFDASAEGFAGGLQKCSGDFGADVGFATVVPDLRGDFADYQSSGVAFDGDRGKARTGFTEFADDALHGFLSSKRNGPTLCKLHIG
jgi:hypothetical protein